MIYFQDGKIEDLISGTINTDDTRLIDALQRNLYRGLKNAHFSISVSCATDIRGFLCALAEKRMSDAVSSAIKVSQNIAQEQNDDVVSGVFVSLKKMLITLLKKDITGLDELEEIILTLEDVFEEVGREFKRRKELPEIGEDNYLEFYQLVLDDFPALIWRSGLDGKCDYFNNTWLKFTGKSLSEEAGEGWTSGVHPEDYEPCISCYIEHFNERKPFEMDYRLKRHDGEYRWIKDFGRPLYNTDGNFSGFIGACYDISDNVTNIEALYKQNKILEGILYNLPVVVMEIEEDGSIQSISGKGLKTMNLRNHQKEGISAFEFFNDSQHYVKRVLEGKSVTFTTTKIIQNKQIWFQNYLFPADGYHRKAIGVLFDITEQKDAEEELKKKNRILDGIMKNMPVIVCRIRKNGTFVESIGSGLEKIGLKENQVVGGNFFDFYPELSEELTKVFANELNSFTAKVEINGQPRFFQTYFFKEEDDEVYTGFMLDVTEKLLAEEQLRESQYFIQQVSDSNPNIILVYDIVSQKIVYMNKMIKEMVGENTDDFHEKSNVFLNIIHPEDLPLVFNRQDKFRDANNDDVILDLEYRIRNWKNEWRWLDTRGVVFKRTEDGNVWQVLVTAQDITERREAEESFRQLNEALKNTIEGIAYISKEGKFLSINDAMSRILGYNSEELLGKDWSIIIHPKDKELALRTFEQLEFEKKSTVEIRGIRKNREKIFKELTMVTCMGQNDNLIGYYFFVRDISARKRAEKNLVKSEALLAEAQQIAHMGSWEWDIQKNNFIFSDELYRIFGYKPGAVRFNLEKYILHIAEEDRKRVNNSFFEALSSKKTFSSEYKIFTQKGELRTILTRGRVITNENGEAVRISGTGLDISELKEAENKLRKSENLLNQAQELAKLGNWELDLTSRKLFWSDEMYNLFELRPNEQQLTFEFMLQRLPEDAQQVLIEVEKKILRTGKPSNYEHRIVPANGQERIVYGQAKPVFDNNAQIYKVAGYMQDITAQKESEQMLKDAYEELKVVEEELKKMNQELEQKVKERTEELTLKNTELQRSNEVLMRINSDLDNFIYTASHDLKTPIANIEGLVNTLCGEIDINTNADLRVLIDLINQSILRFQDTIKDLTEIAKVQKNLNQDEETLDLELLVDEVLQNVQQSIRKSGASIHVNLEHKYLKFSKKNLRSILYNLFSNAIKYASPDRKPEVELSSRITEEGLVCLTIKDNGLGIADGKKDKVFFMFKRMHDHVEGTGLGLYIVKRIVDNAGGRIELDSEQGKGSEFRIYLPR